MGMRSMPLTSWGEPKVKRISPLRGSTPMVARNSPATPMSRPLIWLSSDRLVMQARPRQMRPQISSGPPYFTDRSASWGAAMTSATQENRPPRTEDMVTQPRAFSALPALAMA